MIGVFEYHVKLTMDERILLLSALDIEYGRCMEWLLWYQSSKPFSDSFSFWQDRHNQIIALRETINAAQRIEVEQ